MPEWKAMDMLRQAHQVGLEKMHSMEAAIEGLKRDPADAAIAQLRQLLAFFNGELRHHFLHEEEALFPALSRAIGPMGPVAVMIEEHKSMGRAVDALEEALVDLEYGSTQSTKEAQQISSHILWALRSHIKKEDEMLFPLAEAHLGERDRQEVTCRMETTTAAPRAIISSPV